MAEERIGDGPVQSRHRETLRGLAEGLDRILNGEARGPDRKTGFVLMVFEFGSVEGGRMNYVSNARREDVVVALREQLSYFEGQAAQDGGRA